MNLYKNPNPRNDWKAGDTCFFIEPWSGQVHEGTIVDNNGAYCKLYDKTLSGTTHREYDGIFGTHIDAMTIIQKVNQMRKEQFLSEIKTVEDLVQFMYVHQTSGEDPDYEAKAAVVIKAKELLGLDLKD